MAIIYRITITPTEEDNAFRIDWLNPHKGINTSFIQNISNINTREMLVQWPLSNSQKDIGEKIFRFLDGDSRQLTKALGQSRKQGETLQLQISTCNHLADWPFELLAYDGSFLVPQQIHLVRYESDWGESRYLQPQNRPLKLLFMACSPIGTEPVLNFEKEEETIFKITASSPLDLDVEDSGSLEGLRSKLIQESFDVIHLSGHATINEARMPYFIMEDETGQKKAVSPKTLWYEALIVNPPVLLFLSGCRTGQTAEKSAAESFSRELIKNHHIPAVLGWGRPIRDEHATFMEKLIYHNLSRGKTLLESVRLSKELALQHYSTEKYPPWPLLRLFSCGNPPGALIKEKTTFGHHRHHRRTMIHQYLLDSKVKVLKEGFIGRRRELQESLLTLKKKIDKVGVLLTGMGGMGKSCLAGKICERFPQHTMIIIHGKLNAVTLKQALNDAFVKSNEEKGRNTLDMKHNMTDILIELCNSSFKQKNYIILLDDFEQNMEGIEMGQPRYLLPEAAELLEVLLYYLRYSEKCTSIIITCRYSFELTSKNMNLVKERLKTISLTGFLKSEQMKKIQTLPNIYTFSRKGLMPEHIFTEHGNPRLMEWLDVLLGNIKITKAKQFIDIINDKKEEFIRTHLIRELLNWGGDRMSRLLQWCSIYRRPVHIEGIKKIGDKLGLTYWKKLVDKAIGLTLLEYNGAMKSYQVTPLLREKLYTGIDNLLSCHQAAFDYYSQLFESGGKTIDTPNLLEIEEWIYHALACREEEEAVKQGGILTEYYRNQLAYQESQRIGEWILASIKKELNKKEDSFLLSTLGYVMNELDSPKKAIIYYKKALKIDRALYGENHSEIAVDLNNLGTAYEKQGNYRLALRYYWQAFSIDREIFGEENTNLAQRLNNIGSAFYRNKSMNKAIRCFEEALKKLKKISREDIPLTATLFNNLGVAWKAKGKFKKAIYYYYQALEINRKLHGTEHPDVATSLYNLGVAWKNSGSAKNAADYFEQAVDIWEKIYKDNYPDIVTAYSNLMSAYETLGQREKAKEYAEKVRDIVEKNPDIIKK